MQTVETSNSVRRQRKRTLFTILNKLIFMDSRNKSYADDMGSNAEETKQIRF